MLGNDIEKDSHFLIREHSLPRLDVSTVLFQNGINQRSFISKYHFSDPNEERFKGYSNQIVQSIIMCLVKV